MSEAYKIPAIQQQPTRLPPELQLIILRYVYEPDRPYLVCQSDYSPDIEPLSSPREQLKPIRLVSRVFRDAVTPIVFSSIHLHASELSLQRAESIANSSLAHHVREIVHHEGTFAGAREDKSLFLNVLKSHRRRQDYPKHHSYSADEEQMYTNYLQEVEAGSDDRIFEIDRMADLLRKLPKCITFTTLPYNRDWCDPVSSAYTLRRTGLTYLPNPTNVGPTTDPSFLSSMAQWRPQMLNLANFSPDSYKRLLYLLWETNFQQGEASSPGNWTEHLVYLCLNLPAGRNDITHVTAQGPEYTHLLTHVFHSTRNLVHLEITQGFDLSFYNSIIPDHGLAKLTRLTVSRGNGDGKWAEPQLYNLISQLGSSLKHLHFDQIRLLTYPVIHSMLTEDFGCILRLLFNLTSCTTLESCTGLETVYDAKAIVHMREHFITSGPKPGKATILRKVQQAVCGNRSWPDTFNMDHLPMDEAAIRLEPSVRDTVEAAFVFSAWQYTVDPWEAELGSELKQTNTCDSRHAERTLSFSDVVSGDVTRDALPKEKPGPSTQIVASTSLPARSKRSRISKMLRLK